MANVTITHDGTQDRGRYNAQGDGAAAGHLDWISSAGGVRVATHTLAPHAMRGQGIAAALVDALIADAREQGFRIDPRCPYVAAQFERHPEWEGLRA